MRSLIASIAFICASNVFAFAAEIGFERKPFSHGEVQSPPAPGIPRPRLKLHDSQIFSVRDQNGNGVFESSEIQTSINAAAASYLNDPTVLRQVVLPQGDYILSAALLLRSGVILTGNRPILRLKPGTNLQQLIRIGDGVSNAGLVGLTLVNHDGLAKNASLVSLRGNTKHIYIYDTLFIGHHQSLDVIRGKGDNTHGVSVTAGKHADIWIDGNVFDRVPTPIRFVPDSLDRATVSYNVITNWRERSILFLVKKNAIQNSVRIAFNEIREPLVGSTRQPVVVQTQDVAVGIVGLRIHDNAIYGSFQPHIARWVGDSSQSCRFLETKDTNGTADMVTIHGGREVEVYRNVLIGGGELGFSFGRGLNGARFYQNLVVENDGAGFAIGSNFHSSSARNIVISSNIFRNVARNRNGDIPPWARGVGVVIAGTDIQYDNLIVEETGQSNLKYIIGWKKGSGIRTISGSGNGILSSPPSVVVATPLSQVTSRFFKQPKNPARQLPLCQ